MHTALYRKYRPQTFSDVYGQEHITTILKQEASNNALSHAYLFAGSRGTGKTTCAKILAKVVNCLHPIDGNPCNECENCRAIDNQATTDVIEMDAASNTGVDYIRDLRDNVIYTPSMLKKRVYIIDEAHMLSDSAFNALLKTIEEPPEHVLYIFATTEPHKIPATIISRCQRFEFRRISSAKIVERLLWIAKNESIDLSEEGALVIAKIAQGGMRDAISLLELCAGSHKTIDGSLVNEILGTSPYEKMCQVASFIAHKDYGALFDTINDIVVSSKDVLVFFQDLTAFYRDMMIQKSRGNRSYLELLPQEYELLTKTAEQFDMATLIAHSALLDDAYTDMMKNPSSKRLIAEICLMKLCDAKLSTSLDSLMARLNALEDKVTLLSKGAIAPQPTVEVKEEKTATVEQEKPSSDIKDYQKIEGWSEVLSKIGEKDVAIENFLNSCDCYYLPSKKTYYVVCYKPFITTILKQQESKTLIFNSMVLCNLPIESVTQLEVVMSKKQQDNSSDLDNF